MDNRNMSRRLKKPLISLVFFFFVFFITIHFFSGNTTPLHHLPFTTHLQQLTLVVVEPDQNENQLQVTGVNVVLLPDWELILIHPHVSSAYRRDSLYCLFRNGDKSPASFSGELPWSQRTTFRCSVPSTLRRRGRTLYAPLLINRRAPVEPGRREHRRVIFPWNFLVYESFSTRQDVVVFAKGVNNRQTSNRRPSEIRCVFRNGDDVITTAVTSSSQEVFRCCHPDKAFLSEPITITLEFIATDKKAKAARVIPSIARYSPYPPPPVHYSETKKKSLICASTMVHNVAKFLPEWITYHTAIGVDEFFLYDNGSDDGLDAVVDSLKHDGFNITTYLWPWAKTQEAGFSHSAIMHKNMCKWMLFLDVDEFAFLPGFSNSKEPSTHMMRSILPDDEERAGQVMLNCQDYGPSGLTEHPTSGVTQGYTCRRRLEERHKSLVLLEAIDESLTNVVHHFTIRDGYTVKKMKSWEGVVNQYKYQVWPEFSKKFRRRVSAYVADWTEAVNRDSKDRTPGLGFEAVEPEGWSWRFCDVNDTRLRDVTGRWFGRLGPDGEGRMAWELGGETNS